MKKNKNKLTMGQTGFTLLELLVVIAIMVAVAGTATIALNGVDQNSQSGLVRVEMQNIAAAIRQFKNDTGYYPGEGPFGLSGDTCGSYSNSVGAINPSSIDTQDWFESPANLGQLYIQPELCSDHPLSQLSEWNPETRRGWRGPYIDQSGEGLVDLGNDLNSDVDGDPVAGTAIDNVPGIADTFSYNNPVYQSYADCDEEDFDTSTCLLEWRSLSNTSPKYPDSTDDDYMKYYIGAHGRPYLIFHDDGAYRIVSMGPDGIYDGCDRNNDGTCDDDDNLCTPLNDDIVICL